MRSTVTPAIEAPLHRDLVFAYRIHRPENAGDETIVLLHGSGVDETSLMPLASEIAPRAVLVGVRGRVIQDGGTRWFTRITPTSFDQHSIRVEADAFAGFIVKAAKLHGFDLLRTVFLGYSNGANLITSVMLRHPDLIFRAVLLRAMPVLDEAPAADLSRARALVITGAADVTYAPFAPALVALLRRNGAQVADRTIRSGHEFGAEDARIAREWLAGRSSLS
jgi:phospholipase/carboxylesterase